VAISDSYYGAAIISNAYDALNILTSGSNRRAIVTNADIFANVKILDENTPLPSSPRVGDIVFKAEPGVINPSYYMYVYTPNGLKKVQLT